MILFVSIFAFGILTGAIAVLCASDVNNCSCSHCRRETWLIGQDPDDRS